MGSTAVGMKIPDNRVASISPYFHLQLGELYPKEEIDSFVFLAFSSLKGYGRSDMHLKKEDRISESEILDFINVVKRLKEFEPVQYILGETEFYGLDFKVNNHVLIPRPETEELVDWIIKDKRINPPISILDIGTGSGCIAISLAKKLRGSIVTAIDISKEALTVASENAGLNKANITFGHKDIFNQQDVNDLGEFDIIVSNPPYVLGSEKKEMRPNVLDYEPEIALFVKDDNPLLFYKQILDIAKRHLKPLGNVYFEINESKVQEMLKLCEEKGFGNCELRHDLRGKFRMLKCSNS